MQTNSNNLFLQSKKGKVVLSLVVLFIVTAAILSAVYNSANKQYNNNSYAMSTVITQTAFGKNANAAMQDVDKAFIEYENRLSLFGDEATSEIARVNAAAGSAEGALVSKETADLLKTALNLSADSKGAFAITIAPLTLAWGITTDHPRVPPQSEIENLLKLVDDSAVKIIDEKDGARVVLPQKGMGIDLGGIAKGAACSVASDIYTNHGVNRALLSIGGNIYARGSKPNGDWKIGFRDPNQGENGYIASFSAPDMVVAVSGGYERFFEQDGKKYIHIINPATGMPAESDIASVGAVDKDGAVADFYSTTLFIWGKEKAIEFMKNGGTAIVLDYENNLYVSESLRPSFELYENAGHIKLVFVEQAGSESGDVN